MDYGERLSAAEEEQFETALFNLQVYRVDIDIFVMVIANWSGFHECVDEHFARYINRRSVVFAPRQVSSDVNRHLLNWLGSIRVYLDHMETRLTRRHGENSAEWKQFETLCHDAYDRSFAYRFSYHLRNLALHATLPITDIQFSTFPSKSDPKEPEHRLTIGCNRDKVLAESKGRWPAPLRNEIAAEPPTIEITKIVDEMMLQLQNICLAQATHGLDLLRPDAVFINSLLERAPKTEGTVTIVGVDLPTGSDIPLQAQGYNHSDLPFALLHAAMTGHLLDAEGDIPRLWEPLSEPS